MGVAQKQVGSSERLDLGCGLAVFFTPIVIGLGMLAYGAVVEAVDYFTQVETEAYIVTTEHVAGWGNSPRTLYQLPNGRRFVRYQVDGVPGETVNILVPKRLLAKSEVSP